MQEEMEALLNRRWIRKAEDKELYYKIRDQLGEIRKFATEKMGCPIVENTLLVKMEKARQLVLYVIRSYRVSAATAANI